MSILVILWSLSLFLMLSLFVYGKIEYARNYPNNTPPPRDFPELIRNESVALYDDVRKWSERLRPHGRRMVHSSIHIVRRGHDLFIDRVYGKIKIEPKNVSSFFLKQIAEHKEERDQNNKS